MRKISLQRAGEYLETALEIINKHGNEYPYRLLILEMEKKLKLNDYETSKTKTGGIRWRTEFVFWTIGLVKGGFIKKQKKRWYLTNEGLRLLDKSPLELVRISDESYNKWKDKQEKPDKTVIKTPLTIIEALKDISPTLRPIASSMKIKVDDVSFNDLLVNVEKCLIQIPPFQRNFVWSARAIVDLLDSIYKGYPIGSFIFWKTVKRLPHHRQIGGVDLNDKVPQGTLIDYVLDGQQRITSLYAAVRGAKIEEEYYKFYFDLSTGKFNYERVSEEEENNKKSLPDFTLVLLPNIFVESANYFKYIEQFPERHRNVLHDLFNRFKEYPFSIIYVRDEEEGVNRVDNREDLEKIVKIFLRINDTGKKLSLVAKMTALCWEKNFDLSKKFDELLPESGELATIREDTILQIASAILNNKKCKTNNILEINIDELKEKWDEIVKSFYLALDFVKNNLEIKNIKYIPFDSILVPLSYFYWKDDKYQITGQQANELSKWFWKVSLANRFSSSAESKIEEDCNEFDKLLNREESQFNYPIDWETLKLRLINQDFYFGNAFCKTVLSLYSYKKPRNLKDDSLVDLTKDFSSYNKKQFHHFFPRNYLSGTDQSHKEFKESIVNIAFTPAILNIEISDAPPSDYIKILRENNDRLEESLKTHLIDGIKEFGISDNDFDKFLRKRAEKIVNEFRYLTGLESLTERQLEEQPSIPVDLFETRMRRLINSSLTSEHGDDYWGESIPEDIRGVVNRKIQHDINLHPYNEPKYVHCEERLNLVDIMDYLKIIMVNWTLFRNIFVSKSELEKHFLSINNYRNSIKHVKEMDVVDKKSGEAATLWFKKIFDGLENK